MARSLLTRRDVVDFLQRLDADFAQEGSVYLIGETTQLMEGWRSWVPRIEMTSVVARSHRARFNEAVRQAASALDLAVSDEGPGEVIPLPSGHQHRARTLSQPLDLTLDVAHFDPYSVSFRFIARGMEPDYHLVLAYLKHGWVELDTMEALLEGLLPEFTFDTIQQDPAEFRRRYIGLLQMARSIEPGVTFRPTPV